MSNNELGVTYKKVYERDNYNGIIQSRVIVVKKLNELKPGLMRVPKWILIAFIASIVFLSIILISACSILFTAKQPASYLGNCTGRSCFPNLGLKCVDGKCQCEENKYFTNKCMDKKSYNAFCGNSNQCMSEFECRNGKCQCKSGQYWDGIRCSSSKSYLETCTQNECSSSGYLYCDPPNGLCICPSTRFWTGSYCALKRSNGQFCQSEAACNESSGLKCLNGICSCDFGYSFDFSISNCELMTTSTTTATPTSTTTSTTTTTPTTTTSTTTSTTTGTTTTTPTTTTSTTTTTPTTTTSTTTSTTTTSSTTTTTTASTISPRCGNHAQYLSNPSAYSTCTVSNLCLASCTGSDCVSNVCKNNGGGVKLKDCPCGY